MLLAELITQSLILERFHDGLPIRWEDASDDETATIFYASFVINGAIFVVKFKHLSYNPVWEISFTRNNVLDLTHTKSAFLVLSTVMKAIREFVHHVNPRYIELAAAKNEPSRAKLYPKLIAMMQQEFPQYTASPPKSLRKYIIYDLKRPATAWVPPPEPPKPDYATDPPMTDDQWAEMEKSLQKLTEIETGVDFHDNDQWDKVQKTDYDARQTNLFADHGDYQQIGNIGRYTVVDVGENVRSSNEPGANAIGSGRHYDGQPYNGYRYILFDQRTPIAYIDLRREFSEFGTAARVVGVRVADNHAGKGLGLQLYLWLLKNQFDALYADESHTKAGVAVWKRLFITPGVKLFYERDELKPISSMKDLAKVWKYNDLNLIATMQQATPIGESDLPWTGSLS